MKHKACYRYAEWIRNQNICLMLFSRQVPFLVVQCGISEWVRSGNLTSSQICTPTRSSFQPTGRCATSDCSAVRASPGLRTLKSIEQISWTWSATSQHSDRPLSALLPVPSTPHACQFKGEPVATIPHRRLDRASNI